MLNEHHTFIASFVLFARHGSTPPSVTVMFVTRSNDKWYILEHVGDGGE